MARSVEERLRRLEKEVRLLRKAIPDGLLCKRCGLLLTVHEEYSDGAVLDSGSHAQCYHCGTYRSLDEPKRRRSDWVEKRGRIRL